MIDWCGILKRFAIGLGAGGEKKKRGMLRTAAIILGLARDFKVDSLKRMEDAVVREVEAEAAQAGAEAELKIAEAAERQAAAAYKKAQAEKVLSEADAIRTKANVQLIKAKADADAALLKANAQVTKSETEAIADFLAAIAKIKMAGGSVTFIESELSDLLGKSASSAAIPEDSMLYLMHMSGLTLDRIAEKYGITTRAVTARIRRWQMKLLQRKKEGQGE